MTIIKDSFKMKLGKFKNQAFKDSVARHQVETAESAQASNKTMTKVIEYMRKFHKKNPKSKCEKRKRSDTDSEDGWYNKKYCISCNAEGVNLRPNGFTKVCMCLPR